MSPQIYLALGSNLGDRAANLRAAWDGLPPAVQTEAASPVYETPPWGYTNQPKFLNQVLRASTNLTPQELMAAVKELERRMGRRPSFRNGPRPIDIDILFYDEQIFTEPGLTIPHPRLHERAFVLVPLADLAPDLLHPLLRKTIHELRSLVDTSSILPYEPDPHHTSR